jgi:hypothetical protein
MPTLYPLGLLSRDPGYNTLSNVEKHFYDRAGEDVMLSDIVAFDVKVYDPQAPLIASTDGSIVLAPHDIGYWNLPKITPPIMRGAFVDLAYARYQMSNFFAGSHFAAAPESKSGLAFAIAQPDPTEPLYRTRASAVYDTWSTGYERDGMAQFSGGIDWGANGLDDNNNGIVDDLGEYDTLPPYPHPLRGIEVSIRVVDPGGTQQIRQTSVVANFKHE